MNKKELLVRLEIAKAELEDAIHNEQGCFDEIAQRIFAFALGSGLLQEPSSEDVDELGEDGLREAFFYFLSDGISYDNARDMDDFQSEFGYTKVSECIKAYNGCKDAYDKWTSLCDINIYDILYP